MVPQYKQAYPHTLFDLIYIDGGHTFDICRQDIVNCKRLAQPQTLLWIGDYCGEVETAVL